MVKLPEELRLYVIRLPEELRLYVIRPPEVCWRSARGVVDWIVAAPSTYRGWLLEVCQRSAGGLPEVGRKCAKFESTEDHQRLLPTQEEK